MSLDAILTLEENLNRAGLIFEDLIPEMKSNIIHGSVSCMDAGTGGMGEDFIMTWMRALSQCAGKMARQAGDNDHPLKEELTGFSDALVMALISADALDGGEIRFLGDVFSDIRINEAPNVIAALKCATQTLYRERFGIISRTVSNVI